MADTSTLARPYARAIFGLARADDSLSVWSTALAIAAQVVSDPAAKAFLSRRDLDDSGRVSFLQSVCGELGDTDVLGSGRGENLLRRAREHHEPPLTRKRRTLTSMRERTMRMMLSTSLGSSSRRV